MGKRKTLPVLKKIVAKLKKEKKRIVFTNGCFDLLHPGHIKVFREAKKKGDVLIVGLNSDSSVRKIKGPSRPILDEASRVKVLEGIEMVDYIVLFKEETPYNLIREIKPNFLIKGKDWPEEKIVGSNLVDKVYRVSLYPGYSTTNIIKKIKESE